MQNVCGIATAVCNHTRIDASKVALFFQTLNPDVLIRVTLASVDAGMPAQMGLLWEAKSECLNYAAELKM